MITVTFKDYDKADTFYKFAATSGKEFGFVDMLYSNSMHAETTVLTSGSEDGVMASAYAYRILKNNSDAYLLDLSHSHPGDFNENNAGASNGDKKNYAKGSQYDDRRPSHYRVYTPSVPNVEVKYNGNEEIKTKK